MRKNVPGETPIIARVHYVEFTLPDKYGPRKQRIDIYSGLKGS